MCLNPSSTTCEPIKLFKCIWSLGSLPRLNEIMSIKCLVQCLVHDVFNVSYYTSTEFTHRDCFSLCQRILICIFYVYHIYIFQNHCLFFPLSLQSVWNLVWSDVALPPELLESLLFVVFLVEKSPSFESECFLNFVLMFVGADESEFAVGIGL